MQFVPQWTRRSSGPAWSPQVGARAEACEREPDATQHTFDETIGWKVTIDCAVLENVG